jgi:cellulose synthase/poly-beta-1,6-N-acetylglucosamine synthase-like glycosyltransferase
MDNYPHPQDTATSNKLLLLYLIPVFGFFPSLWTLYRHQGSREQLAVSRLSITLCFTWMLGYFLLSSGAATSNFLAIRLLILNSFFTSGYFLVSIWLIFRVIQGKSYRLPGLSSFAERILR